MTSIQWLKVISLQTILLVQTNRVFAQTVPPLNVSPGALIQRPNPSRQHLENQPINPVSPPEKEIQGLPGQETPQKKQTAERKFFIRKIQVQGNQKLKLDEIRNIVAPFENKADSLSDLNKLADQLTEQYRRKGFLTSRVYLPPQNIKDGIVILQAAEGVIGEVRLEEGHYFKQRAIMPGFNLKSGRLLDVDALSRELRQVNENPDLTVRALLKPGAEPKETDIELKVNEQHPFHLTPYYDNMGRQFIGYQRLGATLTDNNLLGFRDRVLSSVSFTRHSFNLVDQYDLPLGSHGSTLGFDHLYSRLRLGGPFKSENIQGRALILTPRLRQTLYSSDQFNASADLAFDFINLNTRIRGANFSTDRLRVLRPGLNFQEFDSWG